MSVILSFDATSSQFACKKRWMVLVGVVSILVHRTAAAPAAPAAASIFGQRGHEETETLPHPVNTGGQHT